MAKVDLSILRLSAAEILYLSDIPDSASINEAVEMAKKYGGEDSGKFINGILGKVVRSKDA
jgi:N utilization substance protein B